MPTDSIDLAAWFRDAAKGKFPEKSNAVELVEPVVGTPAGVFAFSNRIVVAAAVLRPWLDEQLDASDIGDSLSPRFLKALATELQLVPENLDMVLVGAAIDADESALFRASAQYLHPRLERARSVRTDVEAYQDQFGNLVILGRGVAGRREVTIEVLPHMHGNGHGTRLARSARALLSPEGHVFAQVAPGNAASLRAFISAGYIPISCEVILRKPT